MAEQCSFPFIIFYFYGFEFIPIYRLLDGSRFSLDSVFYDNYNISVIDISRYIESLRKV
jgi:hypothetical protein